MITDQLGIKIPQVLLPAAGIDLSKWAVIACDQFTSQPEYWHKVDSFVGQSPSTYHLILPEVYLGTPEEEQRLHSTWQNMQAYLDRGVLQPVKGPVYVERTVDQRLRRGLMLCLDLEAYNFNPGSQSLIRATEGTIIDRLPPRIRIREKASLELPHILVLIDDPNCTVIEPIGAKKDSLRRLYNFDLMLGSGHLAGYQVDQVPLITAMLEALAKLLDPEAYQKKYGEPLDSNQLLFAVGDGNHSLATAKSIWEKIKPEVTMSHPARYALVEIENIHDPGLVFEPIHRVLFNLKGDLNAALRDAFGKRLSYQSCQGVAEMVNRVDHQPGPDQAFGVCQGEQTGFYTILDPVYNLPVSTLQAFLDSAMRQPLADAIDYVHGLEILTQLAGKAGNAGFYLPAMHKSDLFPTVIRDGVLPRKTFSMGEAREKRFYMECRKIV